MSLEAAPLAVRASPRRVARRDHLWCRPGRTAASLASTRLPHRRNDSQRGAQRQACLVEPSSAMVPNHGVCTRSGYCGKTRPRRERATGKVDLQAKSQEPAILAGVHARSSRTRDNDAFDNRLRPLQPAACNRFLFAGHNKNKLLQSLQAAKLHRGTPSPQ